MEVKKSWMRELSEVVLLLLMGVLCGNSMLWLATGQYPNLIYLGYITNMEIFVLNILPIVVLIFFLYAIIGKSWISYFLGSTIVYIVSLCNYYKLFFRDDPLMFEDVLLAREATNMVGTYSLFIDRKIVVAGVCVILGTILFYMFFREQKNHWKKRLVFGLAACILTFALCPIYKNSEIYAQCDNYAALNRNSATQIYVAHGFMYPFLYSAFQSIDLAPEGYDERQVKNMLAKYTDSDIPESRRVNIIVVMREAYVDFSQYNIDNLDCSGYDWYHQLQKESYTGELYVNVFAGGTVHTEREFLTGNYNVVRDFRGNSNSYVWYFKNQGYIVEGIHPYHQWFYNRRNVNPYLGFQHYRYYENDFENMTSAYYPEDKYFYSEIYNDFNKNKETDHSYFSFNVNVQSHGPYSTTDFVGDWGKREYLTGNQYSTECKFAMNNYMNIIMDSDKQLEYFLDKLKEEDEPVVFVMFSDHLPWLGDGNVYYEEMGIDFSQDSEEINRIQYTTEYLIWANDEAKRILNNDFVGEGPVISPCYLMNLVFTLCSWKGPAYMQAMSEIMEVMPVASRNWRFIIDGNFCDGIPQEYMDMYKKFQYLQYYWRKRFMYN